MLSIRLFGQEPDKPTARFAAFRFSQTQIKAGDLLSMVKPNTRRKLFPEHDDSNGRHCTRSPRDRRKTSPL